MSEPFPVEPERYELVEAARYDFSLPADAGIDRRDFMRLLAAMGGGLLVVATLPPRLDAQESGRGGPGRAAGDLASWLHVSADGRVTAFTGKVEIGQNIRTSLAQTVADELRVALATVTFVMADTDLTPFDQGTFGSRTTPTMAPVLARAAATARDLLLSRAAERWQVDRATLRAENGRVVGSGGRSATYGDLVGDGALGGAVRADAALTPTDRWTVRGTPAHKVNGEQIVTGRHAYTPDVTRPGLAYGAIVRPASYGAVSRSVDTSRAQAMAGVSVVRDGDFIGVVAATERDLRRAVAAVEVDWAAKAGQPDAASVYDYFKAHESRGGRGGGAHVTGDVSTARGRATRVIEASFRIPYIAHVPLEPRAAVAEWTDGRLTVWTGTQRPFGVRTEVATAFHLPEERVRVIVPDMGSGYGGKHTGEQAIEAARLAKAVGKPVKLVYTRPEEFMWGYFRPGGVIDVKAGLDSEGGLAFWEFDNWNSGGSGLDTPYTVANQRVQFHSTDSPLRQGSYRGLAATANHYAREMHMDALARAAGADPVKFRLRHLDNERLKAVLTAAATHAGWPGSQPSGRALGIACGTEKGSYIATVAEVSRGAAARPGAGPAAAFEVHRLVVVFECGAIVNPDGLRNQVEGAVVQGLGGALFEAIDFADGTVLNGTLAQYRVPRFRDVPAIEVVLLDRKDLPSAGAGETPIVCVAPAIGSALRAFGEVEPALPVHLKG